MWSDVDKPTSADDLRFVNELLLGEHSHLIHVDTNDDIRSDGKDMVIGLIPNKTNTLGSRGSSVGHWFVFEKGKKTSLNTLNVEGVRKPEKTTFVWDAAGIPVHNRNFPISLSDDFSSERVHVAAGNQIQSPSSSTCGQYCSFYAYARLTGHPSLMSLIKGLKMVKRDLMDPISQSPQAQQNGRDNDKKLMRVLSRVARARGYQR